MKPKRLTNQNSLYKSNMYLAIDKFNKSLQPKIRILFCRVCSKRVQTSPNKLLAKSDLQPNN